MSFENPALNREEELLIDALFKRSMTELALGDEKVSVLLNKAIDTIKTMARERAYWQFKAECYKKDITKLSTEQALEKMTRLDEDMGLL